MTAKTTEVKVIVGANYGDEGKGLGTDYFCSLNPQSTIGVLTNGSAQRAHTVDTKMDYIMYFTILVLVHSIMFQLIFVTNF